MVQQGDERFARLKHQGLFLHARGHMSPEMADLNRQLVLLERLAGRETSRLDPRVVDRLQGELEQATMEQLRGTGLLEEWLQSWEAGVESAGALTVVPAPDIPVQSSPPVDQDAADPAGPIPVRRSVADALAELERAVEVFSEQLAKRHDPNQARTRS